MAKKHVLLIALVVGLPVWFATVSRVCYFEECPDCRHYHDVVQLRVMGGALTEKSYKDQSVPEMILEDLGRPCTHPHIERKLTHKFWGLVFPYPNHNGIKHVSADPSWYNAGVRARVRKMGLDDPELGEKFYKRVIVGNDHDYAWLFYTKIQSHKAMPWDLANLADAPAFEWIDDKSPIRSLTYAGEPYGGKPTRVFAYYATPGTLAGDTSKDAELPAVVLIHGGGGTAFREWVELWAKRGYAAIAMDLAGSRPIEGQNPHSSKNRTRLPDGGPTQGHDMKFHVMDKPVTEHWVYHAVANVIRAHSLIRSFRTIDNSRTAVTGISWGGYLTCIVAGIDSRFRAAVPVYGCGFLHENSTWLGEFAKMTPEHRQRWIDLYEPSQYLPGVRMPIFFVNGTNDFAYPLDSYMKSIDAVPSDTKVTIRIEPNMKHGHPAGWAPAEIGRFMNQRLGVHIQAQIDAGVAPMAIATVDENDLPELRQIETLEDGSIRVTMTALEVKLATLHYTTDDGPINKRKWRSETLAIKKWAGDTWMVTRDAPPGDEVTAWFIGVTDKHGSMVTTRVVIRK